VRAARPSRARVLLLAALPAAGLAGCAAPPAPPAPAPAVTAPAPAPPPAPARADVVVLLPGPGAPGALAVTERDGRETLLDRPYASARTGPDGRLVAGPVTPEEVRAIFGEALAAQPPRPVSFVVYFVEATDQFTPESQAALAQVLQALAARPAPEITVTGHTDALGSDAFNDALSLRRAERVRTLLVGRGVDPGRIVAAGRGKREPRVPTPDGVPEPRNRRVEITIR
jgi:outer membrane protein OmpA-like peptidoglycan-associated protein